MTDTHRPAVRAALRIAEDATTAWHRVRGPHQPDALIGTVALLALERRIHLNRDDHGAALLVLTPEQFGTWMRGAWANVWLHQPDRVSVAAPLWRWLEQDPDARTLEACHATMTASVQAGLLDRYVPTMRHDADLLGYLLQDVHTRGARSAGGVFHTPADMAELLARLVGIGSSSDHVAATFSDPVAGTGELARAAAETLRNAGRSSADVLWFLNDRDEVASACAAVNSILWDLGPSVLIGSSDIITDPAWEESAAENARSAFAHRDMLVDNARLVLATRDLLNLVGAGPVGAGK